MADLVPVRFLKPSLPYLAGERAWFNEIQAASYIKQGFAEHDKSAGKYVRAASRLDLIEHASPHVLITADAVRDLVAAAAAGVARPAA